MVEVVGFLVAGASFVVAARRLRCKKFPGVMGAVGRVALAPALVSGAILSILGVLLDQKTRSGAGTFCPLVV